MEIEMDVKQMIEVLQAHERGERVDVLLDGDAKVWGEWNGKVLHMDMTYRATPKKEMTLVDKARALANSDIVGTDSRKMLNQLANRIEELEECMAPSTWGTDELLDELKRRTSC